MKKSLSFAVAVLLICVLLTACGKAAEPVSSTPEVIVTPEPIIPATPEPTPEPVIELNGSKVPASEFEKGYTFDLFGQEVNSLQTEELKYVKTEIGDEGLETFRQILPYMKSLKYLSFDRCGTTDEAVAALREEFPDVKIAWRVFFGPFTCMTDTETIWAMCDLKDGMTESLKYCNDVKNLDVGHSTLTDYSFLQYMPKLEVLIISCGDVEDISPIGEYCQNLIFLEAAEDHIRDVSPIANCTKLEYLNIGGNRYMNIDSLRSLYSLPNLKRFYCENIYTYEVDWPAEEDKVQQIMPNCEVSFTWNGDSALNYGWRFTHGANSGSNTDMYLWIRSIFGYGEHDAARLYE